MSESNDAANQAARQRLYLSRARTGTVLGRTFAFYSGKPSTPNSFTGNLVLGASSGGPASNLIDGVGPPITTPIPCDVPLISAVVVTILPDNVEVEVTYANPDPDTDIYLLFAPGTGASFAPLQVTPGPGAGQVTLLFPDDDDLPGGIYTLKIMRASDPTRCFAIRAGILTIIGFVCTIDILNMTGDGVFPNPVLSPGDLGLTVALMGSGFLSGPLTVVFENTFPPFNGLDITLVTVVDDNNLTIDFDATDGGPAFDGFYGVRVTLTAEPTCFDEIGFSFLEPQVAIVSA